MRGTHDHRGKMRPGPFACAKAFGFRYRTEASQSGGLLCSYAGAERRKDENDQLSPDRSVVARIGWQRTKQQTAGSSRLTAVCGSLGKANSTNRGLYRSVAVSSDA